jgi:hypothetical protein
MPRLHLRLQPIKKRVRLALFVCACVMLGNIGAWALPKNPATSTCKVD